MRAWPKNAFIPVPVYWIAFTLPIAFWELCNTDWASGLMSEQADIARHPAIASKSFLFMVFFKASLPDYGRDRGSGAAAAPLWQRENEQGVAGLWLSKLRGEFRWNHA